MSKKKKLSKIEKELVKIQWKPIVINNTATLYMVNSDGYIVNIRTNHVLKGSPDKRGYLTVSIYDVNGLLHTFLIHRLVAEAFIDNPDNKPTVNHLDGNKKNNAVNNLAWATHQENIDHALYNGLRDLRGTKSVSNIYTEDQVHKVCKMLERGFPIRVIANTLNVNKNLVLRILYGGKWSYISLQYKFPEKYKFDFIKAITQYMRYGDIQSSSTIDQMLAEEEYLANIQ